jgi:hypothetical protein
MAQWFGHEIRTHALTHDHGDTVSDEPLARRGANRASGVRGRAVCVASTMLKMTARARPRGARRRTAARDAPVSTFRGADDSRSRPPVP